MRPTTLIAFGLLVAAAPWFPVPRAQAQDAAREQEQPRGDRWQGRQHGLYDAAAPDAGTDGRGANAQAQCHHVPVRVKRADGAYAIRWMKRCD